MAILAKNVGARGTLSGGEGGSGVRDMATTLL